MPSYRARGRRGRQRQQSDGVCAALGGITLGIAGVTGGAAHAATAYTWQDPVSGVWSDASHWTPNTGAPTLFDDTATLAGTGAAHTITLDASQGIGALTVNSPDARLSLNGNTLTLTGGVSSLIRGQIDIAPPGRLIQSGGTFTLVGGTVSGGGAVALHSNARLQLDGGGAGAFVFEDTGTLAGGPMPGLAVIPASVSVTVRGDSVGGPPGSTVSLFGGGTMTNHGALVLDSVGAAAGSTFVASGALNNYGTITSKSGSGGTRRIVTGTMSNYGSVAVHTDTTFDASVNNFGSFTIAEGTRALLPSGRSFNQSAGTLAIPAATPFTMSSGTFALLGGTVSGTVHLTNSTALQIGSSGGGGGNFVVLDSSPLLPAPSGSQPTIAATTTVTVRGDATGSLASLLNVSGSAFTNDGAIVLDSVGAVASSTLAVSSGTFTNNGSISSNVGSGGARRISGGTVTNYGSITVNADTNFDLNVNNYGTYTIAPGASALFGQSRGITQSAGQLNIPASGPLSLSSGTFALVGGTVSGTVNLSGTQLQLGGGSGGNFVVLDSTVLSAPPPFFQPTLAAGTTLTIRGDAIGSPSIVNVSSSTFTNNGAIVLDSVGAVTGSTLSVSGGTFTNNGSLTSNAGSGGARRISGGTMTNAGSVAVNTDTTFDLNVNNLGSFTIAPGTSALLAPGRTFTNSAGTLSIPAATPFNMTGGTFVFAGGTVSGTVALFGGGMLALNGGGGGNYVVYDNATLNTPPPPPSSNLVVLATGTSVTVRGDSAGSTPGTLLAVPTSIMNSGVINLDSVNAVASSTFTVSGSNFANYGTLNSNVGSGGGRTVNANTLNNYGTINVNADTVFNANVINTGVMNINASATFTSLSGAGALAGAGEKIFTGGSSTLPAISTAVGQTIVETSGSLAVGNIHDDLLVVSGHLDIAPSGGGGGGGGHASRVNMLAVGAAGTLDLSDNKLIVADGMVGAFDGGAYSALSGLIASSYNFGAWDQPGITTSMPDAGPAVGIATLAISTADATFYAGGTFGGVPVFSGDVLIMYTYAGDLNLDGLIDGADYGVIDNYVQFPGTSGYSNGDINYDGIIDGADYGMIDNAIQLQGRAVSQRHLSGKRGRHRGARAGVAAGSRCGGGRNLARPTAPGRRSESEAALARCFASMTHRNSTMSSLLLGPLRLAARCTTQLTPAAVSTSGGAGAYGRGTCRSGGVLQRVRVEVQVRRRAEELFPRMPTQDSF